ncbi:MBL fold metallo-hydrolase [Bacillus sp. Marseille-Q1617]|uniref:MBL fold metallo-hydrolase n=1 Tax=Bacillus sp. Marseille-Q1617 TaxID=2736887 RepID=UPI001C37D54D|nr:MBL fold metallo-hydrolase [Bacillus sp. Marseille-Q1617]
MEFIQLDLTFTFNDHEMSIHPTVISCEGDVTLVDCGYPGMLPLLEKELTRKGIPPGSITRVIITNHDDDHMGALHELKEKYPAIKVAAGEIEKDYIDGSKKSLRLIQAEDMLDVLPAEQRDFGLSFIDRLKQVRSVPVDIVLRDGDLLKWAADCKILLTPGHTPGHISIVSEKLDAVITGDAAVMENHALAVANPQFALDLEAAEESLKEVINLNMKYYYCFHGGMFVNKKTSR